MKYADYLKGALAFARDSQNWSAMPNDKFYITTGCDWDETCDNAEGGLDISWAFHEKADDIRAAAPQHFINELVENVEQGLGEEFDEQQWKATLDLFK